MLKISYRSYLDLGQFPAILAQFTVKVDVAA